MTLLLSIFTDDIVPIFIVAAVGFWLARRWRADVKVFSRLTFNVLMPCLVFTALLSSRVSAAEFGRTAVFATVATVGIGLVAQLAASLLRLDRVTASGLVLAATFANVANYGLPLVQYAFGPAALGYGTIYVIVNLVLVYTLGIFVASRGRVSVRDACLNILKAPAVYAVAVAAIVAATGVAVPAPIMRPVQLLSDAALPVQILVLGMQLERARIERPWLVGGTAALRLVAAPLLALAVAAACGLQGVAWQTGLVQAAMPTAVFSGILAVEYDAAPGLVTDAVFASTLISPFTLAVLIAVMSH